MPTSMPSAEESMPEQIVWDLTDLYETPEAWEAEREAIAEIIPSLESYKGRLGESSAVLLEAAEAISEVQERLSRLYSYASLKGDEDLRIAENQERISLARSLYARFGQALSYVSPEVLSVGADKIEEYIAEEPGLAVHAFGLRDILRQAPQTLGDEAEQVMALSADMQGGASRIYGILANSDIAWPEVELSGGESVKISQANYTRYRSAQNREDRKKVFDAFWSTWEKYKNSLGQVLDTHVKGQVFGARARHHDSAVAAALNANNVPVDVYYALIDAVNEGLPTFHRYLKLRQRVLGLDDLHYYDIYPPLVDLDKEYSLDEAKELTLEAAQPLGGEYTEMLQLGFSSPWTHVYPQDGKRSGAYVSGRNGVHPYMLLNYNRDFDSVNTFAHEWGHAVHSLLADKYQPREMANYAIFTAEIASNTTEVFLQESVKAKAASDDEMLFYLGQELENIRGSFYRQTMFAEFELKIHEAVEKGEALSGRRMSEMYLDLLRRYHGADAGVMEIDPLYAIEWAYIPHFYYNFYVFQYATSISGGVQFAEKILAGEEGAADNYLNVLRAGGSRYPYALMKEAGIDLATKAPYEALIRRMNAIMDEIEVILDRRQN